MGFTVCIHSEEDAMELASNATMREQWHMLDAEIEVAQESLQRAERESMIRYPEWKQKVIEQWFINIVQC